jgi:hypothetical protein
VLAVRCSVRAELRESAASIGHQTAALQSVSQPTRYRPILFKRNRGTGVEEQIRQRNNDPFEVGGSVPGELDRTHPLSTTERAAKLIEERYHHPCHVAATLSIGTAQLTRAFRRQ